MCWSSWQTLLVEQARTVPVVVVVVELSMGSMFQHCKGWGRIAITGHTTKYTQYGTRRWRIVKVKSSAFSEIFNN